MLDDRKDRRLARSSGVQQTGKLLGQPVTTWITYWSVPKGENLLEGEGHGFNMTTDGAIATFVGKGIGHLTGKGAGVSFRGSLYYKTDSKELAKLNEIVGVFEFEVDESGNTHGKVWEWKQPSSMPASDSRRIA